MAYTSNSKQDLRDLDCDTYCTSGSTISPTAESDLSFSVSSVMQHKMGRPSFQKGKLDSIPMADYSRDHSKKSAVIGSMKQLTGTATSHGRTVLYICGLVLSCFSLLVPPIMQPLGVGELGRCLET